MPTFKALNIESDDESDIEVDDTKELQTEEALKLYQTALRYHAQGPESFAKAGQAYEQLFQSEIFKYLESQTELRRIELFGPLPEAFELVEDAQVALADNAAAYAESGPSTLPHILHLSHKNYAQFKLDNLAANIELLDVQLKQILADATSALEHFVQALDKDDTDLDLWRRTATVGRMLRSGRVARFCLESVLDGDDEGLGNALSLPSLEDGLAGQQLREIVEQFSDRLSLLQAPLSVAKRRILSKFLKQRLGPYDGILQREQSLEAQKDPARLSQSDRIILRAPDSWAGLGDELLQQRAVEQHSTKPRTTNNAITFEAVARASPASGRKEKRQASPPEVSRLAFQLPTDIAAQFPGLDGGKPTVLLPDRPLVQVWSGRDVSMSDVPATSLPTRKRSGEVAGLHETAEEGRSKSKRIRARDSTLDGTDSRQAQIDINTQWEYDQHLNEVQAVDDWVYETAGSLFERIGVIEFRRGKAVRQELDACNGSDENDTRVASGREYLQAKRDLHAFLERYNDQIARSLLVGGVSLELDQQPRQTGTNLASAGTTSSDATSCAVFPETGLYDMIQKIDNGWFTTELVACAYVEALLRPGTFFGHRSSYREHQWPDSLKTMVVRVLVTFDEALYRSMSYALETEIKELSLLTPAALAEEIQTVFELHLDVYCLIKQANSGVDLDTIAEQSDRLQRWASLAQYAIRHCRMNGDSEDSQCHQNALVLRFVWAITFHTGTDVEVSQDHFLRCLDDLRALFVEAGEPALELQNNAVMPKLSVATLDQETSRLTTKDFFLKVTDQDPKDPVAMIESLEPLLETLEASEREPGEDSDPMLVDSIVSPELVRFVKGSGITVRLLLWQRLRDAYAAIEYSPMVVFCYFSMIKVLLRELTSPTFYSLPQYERQNCILNTMNTVKDMISQVLTTINNRSDALECMDIESLRSAITSLGVTLQLTQVFNVYEDSVRIGQIQQPSTNGIPAPSFPAVTRTVHELQVHIWMILYALLKETMSQEQEQFPTPAEDRFDFLRSLHRNLGIRGMCGASDLMFVRMLWKEFLQISDVDGCESEQAQVFYDLFGLNCFLNPSYELIEHRCEHIPLDRYICSESVDLLLAQASKLPIKELIKHPLKEAIDRVHGLVGRKRPTDAILRNRGIYRAFMRSPIHPLDLFYCLNGEGSQLPVSPIPVEAAYLASKGWYFLMGHLNLAKFRSQKRTGPIPTEDIDIAIAFFNQELEFSMDNWETWFRLAQAYDTKIEESVVWSAEKLNNSMAEIVQLQRAAIHCYTMATAQVNRLENVSSETAEKMNELYVDFATRLYSTSRAPFNMLPFALDDSVKFFSLSNQPMKQAKPFRQLQVYTAWKLVRALCKRALPGRPQSWSLRLLLGKCLWKMYNAPEEQRAQERQSPPTAQEVIACFAKALELLPDKKDSRDTKREPILEPHYKLVSIVHKLVTRGRINLQEAREVLERTPYTRNVSFARDSGSDWARYILSVLKNLRTADKSNWHHRMIVRAAHIRYAQDVTDDPDGDTGASGAKKELTQQMFTKTMVLQVWRPEGERAGRHFVYTARYTRFFVRILEKLRDRTNLEQLARRVRRRPNEIFEHGSVWQDIVSTYLRLLRSYAAIPEGAETSAFSNILHDDFVERKEPLERSMQSTEAGDSAALDVLREVNELKKINGNLVKPGPIDDLIGDSYAVLFQTMGQQLLNEERARQPPPNSSPSRTMSLTGMMNNTDGTNEVPPTAQGPADQPARKKMGVGRREIRSTAEASAQRVAPSTNNLKAHQNVRVQVVINSSRPSISGGEVIASAETSAPGSIHDSADDESELSELEEESEGEDAEMVDADAAKEEQEEAEKRPMFPNLAEDGESESPANSETADETAEAEADAGEVKTEAAGAMREVQDSQE